MTDNFFPKIKSGFVEGPANDRKFLINLLKNCSIWHTKEKARLLFAKPIFLIKAFNTSG